VYSVGIDFISTKMTQISQLTKLSYFLMNLHCPAHDHFTRQLNSSALIDESAAIGILKIENLIISHYTVGQSVLISVIESSTERDLILFARGPFGRTVWRATDSSVLITTPRLSGQIKPGSLPSAVGKPVTPISISSSQCKEFGTIPDEVLDGHDNRVRDIYGPDFATWLDWDHYGSFYPFSDRAGYLRPRIADFLATTGLTNGINSTEVRGYLDGEALRTAIRELDALENPAISPVLLIHVIASDTSLDLTEVHCQRMTPLLATFLQEVGDPITIDDEAAAANKLPPFRTSVPVLHCIGGFAAIVAPVMCKDSGSLDVLKALKPNVQIIFNETNFEINGETPPGSGAVLIVKPSIPGLYHVWQAREFPGLFSPFAAKQLMTAKKISHLESQQSSSWSQWEGRLQQLYRAGSL
jgi:hypothetical protein